MNDHALGLRLRKPLQRLDAVGVALDDAGNGDAGDKTARRQAADVAAASTEECESPAANGDQRDHNGKDAPAGEFAPQPALVND